MGPSKIVENNKNTPDTKETPHSSSWSNSLKVAVFGLVMAAAGAGLSKLGSNREQEGLSEDNRSRSTDTGALKMPKMALADWEVRQVDGSNALVGTVQIAGRNQPIMLTTRNTSSEDYYGKFGAQLADKDLARKVLEVLNSNPVGNFSGRSPIKYRGEKGGIQSVTLGSRGEVTDGRYSTGFVKKAEGLALYTTSKDLRDELAPQAKAEPARPNKEKAGPTKGKTASEKMDELAVSLAVEAAVKENGMTREELRKELRSLPEEVKNEVRRSLLGAPKK